MIHLNSFTSITTLGQPSRQPISRPTSQPSRMPSRRPTTQPSRQPLNHPSSQPSRQPTTQPTKRPTSFPTNEPSARPTTKPTSSAPTTFTPTLLITAHPTMKPSSAPSYEPTASPTCTPSYKPSALPSCAPSIKPTRVPSYVPSYIPTSAPTTEPTYVPTNVPSYVPSSPPSHKPTYVPTSAPTLSEATLLTTKLQNYLSSNFTTMDSSTTVLYQEVVARGTLPAVGGCNNWKVSTGSSLSVSLLTQVATSVSMFVYDDNRSVPIFPLIGQITNSPSSDSNTLTLCCPHCCSFSSGMLTKQHNVALQLQQPKSSTQSPMLARP